MDRRAFITSTFSLPLAVALPTNAGAALPPRRPLDAGRTGTVGHAEVTTVREVINAFTRADERLGGGSGRTAIAEYLATDATAYLQARPANPRVRAQMYGAVAEAAACAGGKPTTRAATASRSGTTCTPGSSPAKPTPRTAPSSCG